MPFDEHKHQLLWGLCPKEVGLLYNQVYVCLDLVATAKRFPKWFYNLHFRQHCDQHHSCL